MVSKSRLVQSRGYAARIERRSVHGHEQPPAAVLDLRGQTERTLATILFADVIASTELSRSIDLEQWWSVVGQVFEEMCASVHRFGGWVEGFTGDGVMGVFEPAHASSAHAEYACDHARRGCWAALALRDAMVRCADELQRLHAVTLSVRIGLHSGEVLTGTIGHDHGRHYTAGGYPVAIAKRIESLAAPGCVYVSGQTAGHLERPEALRDLGTFSVKGAPAPVRVFELIGEP
jgi:adenylate cyclase